VTALKKVLLHLLELSAPPAVIRPGNCSPFSPNHYGPDCADFSSSHYCIGQPLLTFSDFGASKKSWMFALIVAAFCCFAALLASLR